MNYKGVEYTVTMTAVPGVWKWQFRIGDQVKTGKTETRINPLAHRRVELRIDRELKNACGRRPSSLQGPKHTVFHAHSGAVQTQQAPRQSSPTRVIVPDPVIPRS